MTYQIIQGDALAVLRTMGSESVQCCVTSPPYFALRDYKSEGQIGLETTPQEYVAKLVEVFTEVRRVLRNDGICWLNLGDSYAGSWGDYVAPGSTKHGSKQSTNRWQRPGYEEANHHTKPATANLTDIGLKKKDLIGIPWMVAFALRSSGWWLRSQLPWVKRSAMPESAADRPAKALEDIFLLTKSERYYFDMSAVRRESITNDNRRPYGSKGAWEMDGRPESQRHGGEQRTNGAQKDRDRSLKNNRNGITGSLDEAAAGSRNFRNTDLWLTSITDPHGLVGIGDEFVGLDVTPNGFSEAHFATFPPKLIEPLILAGSKEGDLVLDPFTGAGTTALVALKHRRQFIGVELNPDYIKIAEKRLQNIQVNLI